MKVKWQVNLYHRQFCNSLISIQVCIAGAASGMGLATAQLLASRGATISLADINQEALTAAMQSFSDSSKHVTSAVDVRNRASVESWIASTKERYGRIDGAVNMAGIICKTSSVAELSDADWDRSFAVNTKGVLNCIRAQLNAMGLGGSIVSSPSPTPLPYSTSTYSN